MPDPRRRGHTGQNRDIAHFEFTGRQFRSIGSDLLTYPVARAVAASSAFPFLLAPVNLANHCGTADCAPDTEDTLALQGYWKNKRRYWAAYNNTTYADREAHPWLHLMDGGSPTTSASGRSTTCTYGAISAGRSTTGRSSASSSSSSTRRRRNERTSI